jgi:hypothetical protein
MYPVVDILRKDLLIDDVTSKIHEKFVMKS